jgi:hypothetical protein
LKNGPYELIVAPDDYPGRRYRGRYAYEHHVVWWQNTGKLPRPGYYIHHQDEDKRNNRFSNLTEMLSHEHSAHHNPVRAETIKVLCGWCASEVTLTKREWKKRKQQGNVAMFCSRACGARRQHADGRAHRLQ